MQTRPDERRSERGRGRPRGRPRDPEVRERILDAARRLGLAQGYDAVSMDAIAEAAGASKATVYRSWRGKSALLCDALLGYATSDIDPAAATAPEFILASGRAFRRFAPILKGLMAEAQRDERTREILNQRLIAPRRQRLSELLGETSESPLVSALFGALWYRILLDEPLDDEFLQRLSRLAERAKSGNGRPSA